MKLKAYHAVGLSRTASPEYAMHLYVNRTIHAGIIPIVDTLRSLTIGSMPGLIAGIILT